MIKSGILNPAINSLLSRVRHTNTLVIADRGFPFWPHIETVDISLVDDVPRVMDVLEAIKNNYSIGRVFAAEEFLAVNSPQTTSSLENALLGIPITFEPHVELKRRVPHAIGLIRTGDTTQYSNLILESA
ncbi:D-ribose pyranase [Acidicapsa acidisoli]|uniref:D-ribose pyranase n=1 Tax=Acidicapsa acidisoli TaxID=1615681 RepID=UPI0021E01169|nr:D-ribose pyranase [Acidicapsa acidisoli]